MLLRLLRLQRICLAILFVLVVIGLLETRSTASQFPRLMILDGSGLNQIKRRLQSGDRELGPSSRELTRAAEQSLHLRPLSVTDKNLLPPSGNKHDYMSLAPYWWPNPRTPDGLPFVRRDGAINPERDRTSDRQRMEFMIQSVKTLALAYFFTDCEDYAVHAAQFLRVWFLDPSTKMNPHLRYAQSVPGRNFGRSAGIIETHELPELVDFVSLLDGSKPWSAHDQQQWHHWIKQYAAWLTESPAGLAEAKTKNNHGTWYDVQVAAFAIFTGQNDRAKRILGEFPVQRISSQIQPDGRQPYELARTRSWDYAVFNLDALFDAASIGDKLGLDLWNYRSGDGRSIRQALDSLVPFATGENTWHYRQMTPLRPEKVAPLLRRAALAYREPTYEQTIAKLTGMNGDERWRLLYPKFTDTK